MVCFIGDYKFWKKLNNENRMKTERKENKIGNGIRSPKKPRSLKQDLFSLTSLMMATKKLKVRGYSLFSGVTTRFQTKHHKAKLLITGW